MKNKQICMRIFEDLRDLIALYITLSQGSKFRRSRTMSSSQKLVKLSSYILNSKLYFNLPLIWTASHEWNFISTNKYSFNLTLFLIGKKKKESLRTSEKNFCFCNYQSITIVIANIQNLFMYNRLQNRLLPKGHSIPCIKKY